MEKHTLYKNLLIQELENLRRQRQSELAHVELMLAILNS